MTTVDEGHLHRRSVQAYDHADGEAKKVIESLQFKNPGPQLKCFSEFDPEKSVRELRKINRLISDTNTNVTPIVEKGKRSRRGRKPKFWTKCHDGNGRLITGNVDLCDCQDKNCTGCHFPCNACGSEKCGIECRRNRNWTYCKDVSTTDSFILSFKQRADSSSKNT